MFAVIKTGGRQYRVVPDDVLEIGKIAGDVGTIVQLGEVLVVGGDTPVLGTPTVARASVAAEVLRRKRGPKVIAFKSVAAEFAPQARLSRRDRGASRHQILTDNGEPSIGPRPKRKRSWRPPPTATRRRRPPEKAPAKKAAAKPAAEEGPGQEGRREGQERQEVMSAIKI